jgi:excisionase family DNA binding protein
MEPCTAIENGYWDIRDLSNYLKVKMKTLYALVPEIPHYRVGKLIRFRKEEIDSWMEHKRGMAYGQGVTSGNHRVRGSGKGNADIGRLIRKAIDQSKDEIYNPYHGKSDRSKGPKKETKHGSL